MNVSNNFTYLRFIIVFLLLPFISIKSLAIKVDVLVIGGGASGTTATIQSARMGVKTLLIEESPWLGGMLTSAGVSAVDGNYKLPSGLWGEFLDSLVIRYGNLNALKTGWVSNVLFEPSVGNDILKNIVKKETHAEVWFNTSFTRISKKHGVWNVQVLKNGEKKEIEAKILIDGTELGDVAKACGVKYDIGMDARAECGEDIAPEHSNDIIQDLTYVAILKDYGSDADMTISQPEDYDPSSFYCCCKDANCDSTERNFGDCNKMMTYGKLPNGKYMINWPGNGNDCYVNLLEMNSQERIEALKAAKNMTLGYIYYMQTELGFKNFGIDSTEYLTEDGLPFIPYYRESRRIHGLVRFNINDIENPFNQPLKLYRTGIAVGDYPVDQHHRRYDGDEKFPEIHFPSIPSYSLPLGVLIPESVKGLIVAEKSISVSNIVNGTTRLQPVVLQIGQAAGALAGLAIKSNTDVAKISVRDLQNVLLKAKGYIMPYLDVPTDDLFFPVLQRIGATGIMKGEGKSVGWKNETWFHAENELILQDLEGLSDVYPDLDIIYSTEKVTIERAMELIAGIAKKEGILINDVRTTTVDIFKRFGIADVSPQRVISRKEMALLIDQILDPFNRKQPTIQGCFM